MKKILAVFDGTEYSEGASKYAIELAKATNSLLVGSFIHDLRYINFPFAYYDHPYVDFEAIEQSKKEEAGKINANIKLFKEACNGLGVHHKIHLDKGVPLHEVVKESVYADVLIVDSHTGFFTLTETTPSPFLKDLLADSHCPVLIVPHHFTDFDKVILCYDGNPSSIYAIKMFAYLFPELHNLETVIVSVNETSSKHLKEGGQLKDLVKQHYHNATYEVLLGKTEDELVKFLKQKGDNSIVVMGSYGRNAISRFFQQSMSNRIIKELNVPVFITHQ